MVPNLHGVPVLDLPVGSARHDLEEIAVRPDWRRRPLADLPARSRPVVEKVRGDLDVLNFTRICRWLEVDPADLLGFDPQARNLPVAAVHFRSDAALSSDTSAALQELIIKAHKTFAGQNRTEG